MSQLVSNIRGIGATSERLRSDHILTLELFQATVDENPAKGRAQPVASSV